MKPFQKLIAAPILAFSLVGLSNAASAAHFAINDIINLSADGFTSTVFHTASECGGMCGSILENGLEGTVTSGSEYDSALGDINFGFDLDGGNSVLAAGNILFPGNNDNAVIGSITYTFAQEVLGSFVHTIEYLDFDYGVPNSFDGAIFMALWGADATPLGSDGKFTDLGGLGSDLRLDLTALPGGPGHAVIPLPAALPLYGTGLAVMGIMGWRRKRKAATF